MTNYIYKISRLINPSLKAHIMKVVTKIIGGIYRSLYIDALIEKCFGIKRKVIVKIDGGLGSQMWQFALGYSIANKLNYPLYLEIEFFKHNRRDIKGNENRFFLLFDVFPKIKEKYANRIVSSTYALWIKLLAKQQQTSIYEIDSTLLEERQQYLNGYYSNAQYIQGYHEKLKELFTFDVILQESEMAVKEKIENCESCFVHIRRGDFLDSSHQVCTDDYYINAMKKVQSCYPNVTFFIFTNDEIYVRHLFNKKWHMDNTVLIEGRNEENPTVDMYLMSLCKHSIISNSGFSWFPAWLNYDDQNRMVIMPSVWTANEKLKNISKKAMYLPGWIQL